jgi:hypothetical protein
MADPPRSHRAPVKGPEAPENISQNPGRPRVTGSDERGQDGPGWPPGKERAGPEGPLKLSPLPSAITTRSIPRGVVSLEAERHWRRLRLTADTPVPCEGVCRCYGVALGGSA